MGFKKIRIVPNYKKRWAVRLAKNVALHLRKRGFEMLLRKGRADATICIGGDGTIFYANHLGRISGAVLGIGSGSSVVCALKSTNWERKLHGMLKRGKVEKRLTLEAKWGEKTVTAINDVVLHSDDYRMIRIFLGINWRGHVFDGDGIIVATPLGSTAYAYSAGGKILRTKDNRMQLVPICPYKRKFAPKTLQNSVVSISCDRSSSLMIDGIFMRKIDRMQKVTVKKGGRMNFIV